MGLEISLVGHPSAEHRVSDGYRPRSRKTWALLSYLVLSERPPSRSRLSSLLFGEAADPLRALRWSLSELRRLLGPDARVGGDPVVLDLPEGVFVDVLSILGGQWEEVVGLENLAEELLAGFEGLGSPEFEAWLLAERRHIAASTEDVLHEACLALLARGDYGTALPLAVSLVGMNPYRESHQALLIRVYLIAGDADAAERQFDACARLFADELGVIPGPAVRAALQSQAEVAPHGNDVAALNATIEAGMAALLAGAADSAVVSLRSGVALADSLGEGRRQITSRLALADALFSSEHGDDEEGAMVLHKSAELAKEQNQRDLYDRARVELGYLDMLGARYDRAEQWLDPAGLESEDHLALARANNYLGCLQSDRASYDSAEAHLQAAVEHSQTGADPRQEAYGLSLLGRMHFLLGNFDSASTFLTRSIDICETNKWFTFIPWPQSFLGELELERGDRELASQSLEQAFARACQIGDPCWEAVSGRGLALLAEINGDTEQAYIRLQDAMDRCNRRSDTYVWAKGYILDAQCSIGLAHDHENTARWIEGLYDLATRTGMRELQAKAMMHRSAYGIADDQSAVVNLAQDIANPRLLAAAQSEQPTSATAESRR